MDLTSIESFAEKQEAIRIWIENVLDIHLPQDDFWSVLKSGEVLCRLMLTIEDGSIPIIHVSTKLSFLKKENIYFFITACKEFGVSTSLLFEVNDLYEEKDLEKVVQCLESLALKCNEMGYPVLYNISPPKDERSTLILRSIEKQHSNRHSRILTRNLARQSIAMLSLDDDIVNVHNNSKSAPEMRISPRRAPPPPPQNPEAMNQAVIQLVASLRGRYARRRYMKQVTDEAYREMLVNELFETEKDYVDNLKIIVEQFFKPLMENANSLKPMISVEDVKSIFSSIDVIKAYNEQLLEEITPRVSNWSPTQRVGDIFLKMAAFLKVYTNYVSNYSHAINVLSKCKRKEKVKHFFEENEMRESSRNHTIISLLIMPVQRVPRYYLLLQEISKRTWKNHADYNDIVEAEQNMEKVVLYINEKTRDFENVHKVTEIQEQFQGIGEDLALPHRRFVNNFQSLLSFGNKVKQANIYIFNDLIVLTKRNKISKDKKSKKVKEKVVDTLKISDISIEPGEDASLSFYQVDEKLYSLEFNSSGEKDLVKQVLERLKEELSEKFTPVESDDKALNLKKSKLNLNPFSLFSTIKGALTNDDKKDSDEKRKTKQMDRTSITYNKSESSSEEQSKEEDPRIRRRIKHSKSMRETKNKSDGVHRRERSHTKEGSNQDQYIYGDS